MDIGFVGMLVVLLFMTAGPILALLLLIGTAVATRYSIAFHRLLPAIAVVFVPLHAAAMFLMNPAVEVTPDQILESLGISVIYAIPLLVVYVYRVMSGARRGGPRTPAG